MSLTISDPDLLSRLRQADDVVELKDPDGRILGTFSGAELGRLPPGVRSPFSAAGLAERRKNRSGRPLADILRDLRARG
jgi:hypothetical protein